MKAKEFVHHGLARASAFVIDVHVVGMDEARRRVLDLYRPGVQLQAIDEGLWLIVLPEPVDVDARGAPGLVLVDDNRTLAGAPELTGAAVDVAFWRSGAIVHASRSSIPDLDPSSWIDVDSFPIERLTPLTTPFATEPIEATPLVHADLRKIAHVRERSAESREMGAALAAKETVGSTPGRRARTAGGEGSLAGIGPLQALSSFMASLILRTPIAGELRRRQARYLERLASQFEGDLDEALRNAIPLGGLGPGAYTLRMPQRRPHLRITRHGLVRPASVGLGQTVYMSLHTMYRRAAEQLVAAGRFEEAAFVLVELLNSPEEAVAMLERNGRLELAATIAEDRRLDPTLVARLWWLAGDRNRAVAIARRHRVFGPIIDRLVSVDPAQAEQLRLEWVDSLERAGDVFGAVAAGWSDVSLRPRLAAVVRRGVAIGGPAGAALQAYRLALEPTEEDLAETRALVAGFSREDSASLRSFALALADATAEPAVDREFASLTIRALARVRSPSSDQAYSRAHRAIRDRADPTLAADLPRKGSGPYTTSSINAPAQPPGLVRIWDAAALPSGQVLVALGNAGCHLVTPDGRTAARWDTPAHQLVIADHGGSALVLAARGEIRETVHLDLTTRKSRPYGAIRASLVADTFDGAIWPVVDERGVAFHDTIAGSPRVMWRELEAGWLCHSLSRDDHQLAALIGIPASRLTDRRLELWRWSMPGITLNARSAVNIDDVAGDVHLLSDALSIWRILGAIPKTIGLTAGGSMTVGALAIAKPSDGILVSQGMIGLVRQGGDGECELLIHRGVAALEPCLRVPLGSDGVGFRAVGDRVTAWDGTGRLVAADVGSGRLITATRLVL